MSIKSDKNMETAQIVLTRVNRDRNGNPRYTCDYKDLLTAAEIAGVNKTIYPMSVTFKGWSASGNRRVKHFTPRTPQQYLFELAVWKANCIGGKRWRGDKIIFQSYNTGETIKDILRIGGTK